LSHAPAYAQKAPRASANKPLASANNLSGPQAVPTEASEPPELFGELVQVEPLYPVDDFAGPTPAAEVEVESDESVEQNAVPDGGKPPQPDDAVAPDELPKLAPESESQPASDAPVSDAPVSETPLSDVPKRPSASKPELVTDPMAGLPPAEPTGCDASLRPASGSCMIDTPFCLPLFGYGWARHILGAITHCHLRCYLGPLFCRRLPFNERAMAEAQLQPPFARFHPVPTAPVFAPRYEYAPPELMMVPAGPRHRPPGAFAPHGEPLRIHDQQLEPQEIVVPELDTVPPPPPASQISGQSRRTTRRPPVFNWRRAAVGARRF
jgi:hypothetical protein